MSNKKDICAVSLAGGNGTRLRSVVNDRPKVMAKIKDRPFLFILLDKLLDLEIPQIVVSTGYMSEFLEKELGNSYKGKEIFYSKETEPLGTGGAFSLASSRFYANNYLLMNGDNFANYSFEDFFEFHICKKANSSILVRKEDDARRYGTVEFDNLNKVTLFKEKNPDSNSAFVNCGVYLIKSTLKSSLPKKTSFSLEVDFFPKITDKGFYAFETKGNFIDIGTPESLEQAQTFF